MTHNPSRLATILRLALFASIASLLLAFIAQYGFGLLPCHLCYAQRVPFAIVIVLAVLGLWKPRHQIWLILIIGTAFLINSGIASYHAAVEKQWVSGPTGCTTGEAPANESTEDFLKRIQAAPVITCDQPQWQFHGITMAGLNAVWCLFLSVVTFAALWHARKKEVAHA